jgi:hypothetical protein
MLNHDIHTIDETTETPVKFIKKINSPDGSLSSAQAIDRASSSVETDHSANEGKSVTSVAAHTSSAGHSTLADSLSTKIPTMDRRPGGGCIPVSGLDR